MDCKAVHEALSACLDDEHPGIDPEQINAHCQTCADCNSWRQHAHGLHRQLRVATAPNVPDLTPTIMKSLERMPLPGAIRQRALQTCRILLACCAALQLFATLPMLFGSAAGPVHLDHELGSWDLALSAGLLFAAIRPARAWGMLPLVGAVTLALGTTAIVDVSSAHTSLAAESSHLMEAIGLLFLWNIARLSRTETEPHNALRLA